MKHADALTRWLMALALLLALATAWSATRPLPQPLIEQAEAHE